MAARTCLLCGKALSRIWADKGEEFCSREHRNQYRLRRGMDRLMEANAVANVMRRRENPKQIPAAILRAAGSTAPRSFGASLRRPPAELSVPVLQPGVSPALDGASRFRLACSLSEGAAVSREWPFPAPFPGPEAHQPRTPVRLKAHVLPAPPAKARPSKTAAADRSASRITWRGTGKPVVAALLAKANSRMAAPMPESRPARRLTSNCVGRALRVSSTAGFRLPERALPTTRFAAPEVYGLPEPAEKPTVAAAAPLPVIPSPLEIERTLAEMRVPAAPAADFGRHFRWPGPIEVTPQFRDAANTARHLAVPFGVPEDSVKERK